MNVLSGFLLHGPMDDDPNDSDDREDGYENWPDYVPQGRQAYSIYSEEGGFHISRDSQFQDQ